MKKLLFVLCSLVIGFTGKSSEAQTGWSLQNNPLPDGTLLGKIQFVSPTEGWISANKGDLLHTTDAGATWIRVVPFPDDTVFSMSDQAISMWWVDKVHGWKMNLIGTGLDDAHGAVIHKTNDGGVTWQKKVLSTTVGDAGIQVQFVDENNGWALVYNLSSGIESFFRTNDGGNNWVLVEVNGVMGIFYFVDASNGWSTTRYAADSLTTPEWSITHTTDGGANWSVQYTDFGNTDSEFSAIQFTDANNGWVVGKMAKIFRTTNGGTTWTAVTNTGIPSYSYSKCLYFLDENTGWIGTNEQSKPDGGTTRTILHTTDGGKSWTHEHPSFLSDSAVFSIYFVDAQNGWFTAGDGVIGHYTTGTTVVEENNNIPNEFSLLQNYPNPFNPTTVIKYSIKNAGMVNLKVYDILGQEIATLVNKAQTPGPYEVEFNAQNLTSGIYFYRLTFGAFSETKKLLLLK